MRGTVTSLTCKWRCPRDKRPSLKSVSAKWDRKRSTGEEMYHVKVERKWILSPVMRLRSAMSCESDQGVQYLSNAYISLLRHHGIEISVARRGCPWENGYAERLIRTLKEEEVHLNAYEDIHEARARIGHFITQVYNHKRPHSALGYLTPVEFEQKNLS